METLDHIKQDIIANLKCPLKDAATNLVFGKGNGNSDILFIGEAPGEQEDIQGLPFVGRAGDELNTLLGSISLTVDDVYIANILKYRPPGNRDPEESEIASHTPFLIRQIKAIQPEVIVTLGNFATKFVLAGFQVEGMNKISGITELHGKMVEIELDGKIYRVIPSYHPAAMLYRPQLREIIEQDFKNMSPFLEAKKSKNLKEFF